mmetsp:Transcript_6594/g.19976  ORF Transcript_6594/g.19976 Transcript_6594/m.19976 type:complete len:574 (-) Transcript_6594:267-1988(-)
MNRGGAIRVVLAAAIAVGVGAAGPARGPWHRELAEERRLHSADASSYVAAEAALPGGTWSGRALEECPDSHGKRLSECLGQHLVAHCFACAQLDNAQGCCSSQRAILECYESVYAECAPDTFASAAQFWQPKIDVACGEERPASVMHLLGQSACGVLPFLRTDLEPDADTVACFSSRYTSLVSCVQAASSPFCESCRGDVSDAECCGAYESVDGCLGSYLESCPNSLVSTLKQRLAERTAAVCASGQDSLEGDVVSDARCDAPGGDDGGRCSNARPEYQEASQCVYRARLLYCRSCSGDAFDAERCCLAYQEFVNCARDAEAMCTAFPSAEGYFQPAEFFEAAKHHMCAGNRPTEDTVFTSHRFCSDLPQLTADMIPEDVAGGSDSGGEAPGGAAGETACFPASALVTLPDGSYKRMDQLAIGDAVLTRAGHYAHVFAFSHRDPHAVTEMVSLVTRGRRVTLSGGHLVRTGRGLASADQVGRGDCLVTADGSCEDVERSGRVWTRGLYNPHTTSGEVVVDDVAVSCYTRAVRVWVARLLLSVPKVLYTCGVRDPLWGVLDRSVWYLPRSVLSW